MKPLVIYPKYSVTDGKCKDRLLDHKISISATLSLPSSDQCLCNHIILCYSFLHVSKRQCMINMQISTATFRFLEVMNFYRWKWTFSVSAKPSEENCFQVSSAFAIEEMSMFVNFRLHSNIWPCGYGSLCFLLCYLFQCSPLLLISRCFYCVSLWTLDQLNCCFSLQHSACSM